MAVQKIRLKTQWPSTPAHGFPSISGGRGFNFWFKNVLRAVDTKPIEDPQQDRQTLTTYLLLSPAAWQLSPVACLICISRLLLALWVLAPSELSDFEVRLNGGSSAQNAEKIYPPKDTRGT